MVENQSGQELTRQQPGHGGCGPELPGKNDYGKDKKRPDRAARPGPQGRARDHSRGGQGPETKGVDSEYRGAHGKRDKGSKNRIAQGLPQTGD